MASFEHQATEFDESAEEGLAVAKSKYSKNV